MSKNKAEKKKKPSHSKFSTKNRIENKPKITENVKADKKEFKSPQVDIELREVDPDFDEIVNGSRNVGGNFVLKSERVWSSNELSYLSKKYHELDTKSLNLYIQSIPFYEKIPMSVKYTQKEIEKMEITASKYNFKVDQSLPKEVKHIYVPRPNDEDVPYTMLIKETSEICDSVKNMKINNWPTESQCNDSRKVKINQDFFKINTTSLNNYISNITYSEKVQNDINLTDSEIAEINSKRAPVNIYKQDIGEIMKVLSTNLNDLPTTNPARSPETKTESIQDWLDDILN